MSLLTIALLIGGMASVQGNQLIVQRRIINASSLSGFVTDSTRAPINAVKVELIACSSFEKPEVKVLTSATTDDKGFFAIESHRKKLYCLELQSPGFDLLRVMVNIEARSHALNLVLTPGT